VPDFKFYPIEITLYFSDAGVKKIYTFLSEM